MADEGTRSIVVGEHASQVRDASTHYHHRDRPPYCCPDAAHLRTFLHACALEPWAIQHDWADLRQGQVAALRVAVSPRPLDVSCSREHRGEGHRGWEGTPGEGMERRG